MALLRGAGSSLRRWLGRSTAEVDEDQGEPEIGRIREAAEAADWAAVRDQLTERPESEDRTWLITAVARTANVENWIPQAVEAEPDSALPLLVAGARHVNWGWEARTGARAEHVSRDQFQVFHNRLRTAEKWLYEAAEREPQWVSPWYFLQMSGRGLQVGQTVARRRFEAAVRRHPHHLGAHQQQLQQLCDKWGGSHEEMHAFATQALRDAPAGSMLGQLVALAHIEQWLALDSGADAEYLGQPGITASLTEAAERSIWHEDFAYGQGWLQVYNTFAMAFSLTGDCDLAKLCFDGTNGIVTAFPWNYLDAADPAAAYRENRAAAGR
ncbi:hypothetical protein [Streptomyces sp. A10(2020)]|uniref:hypothetical protein n=1 Tax=Streptomyces sp. A10(2020) TaxID=2782013 RepID=UPI001F5E1445|nr:hypothetical protein [Streptomyces sp. A10(2020)]